MELSTFSARKKSARFFGFSLENLPGSRSGINVQKVSRETIK